MDIGFALALIALVPGDLGEDPRRAFIKRYRAISISPRPGTASAFRRGNVGDLIQRLRRRAQNGLSPNTIMVCGRWVSRNRTSRSWGRWTATRCRITRALSCEAKP